MHWLKDAQQQPLADPHRALKMRFLFSAILLEVCVFASAKPTVDAQITMLENSNSPMLQYPTQFTQNIVVSSSARGGWKYKLISEQPKQIHSHNDCQCTIITSV